MFSYESASITAICSALSSDRLDSYLKTAAPANDERAALDLYVWNAELSGSLFWPLHAVEVGIRNAMHEQMSQIFGTPAWYSQPAFKRTAVLLLGDVFDAANRLVRDNKSVDPPHMVAAFHFGFWTQLLKPGPDGNYTRHFWNAGLYKAFPNYPGHAKSDSGKIRSQVMALKDFRNRVAHHEPIHNKNPKGHFDRIIKISGWVAPTLSEWIKHHSDFDSVLSRRP